MPPVNPTASQLSARLSPTASNSNINLPTEGQVFTNNDSSNPTAYTIQNGKLVTLTQKQSIANTNLLGSDGQSYSAGAVIPTGVSVKTTDPGFRGQYVSSQYVTPGYNVDQIQKLPQFDSGVVQDYISQFGSLPTSGKATINSAPNSIATPAQLGAASAATKLQLAPDQGKNVQSTVDSEGNTVNTTQTPLANSAPVVPAAQQQNVATSGAAPTLAAPQYQLLPGETIPQYNARISTMNPNLPAPGTTSSTGVTNTAISSANLATPSTPNFLQPTDTSANTTGANASAAATQATIAQQQAAYAETQQQQKESDLSILLEGLNTQEAGKSTAQATANTNAGVDTKQATVNDLSSKLATLTNEAAAIKMTPQPNEGVTTAIDTRQRDAALQTNAIAALAVSSLLNAANASLATAQAQANKAVALIFDPIEAQIKADTANLQLIKDDPKTTNEDKQQADAQLAIKQAQSDAVAAQKTNLADVFTVATNAAAQIANFTPTAQYQSASQALTAIQQAHTPGDALAIAVATGLTGAKTGTWGAPYMLGGSYVQKNSQTGEVRQAVNPPNAPAPSKNTYSSTDTQNLIGAGIPSGQINSIKAYVDQYGLQAALDNSDMTEKQKTALKAVYGQ